MSAAAGAWPVLVGAVLVGGYLLALHRRPATLPRWRPGRTVAFSVGVGIVVVGLSPWLATLAHHDPRAHMVQHLLLGMYAPLGLVLGAPATLLLGSLPGRGRRCVTTVLRSRAAHLIGHPVTAAVLNVGGLYLLYLTPLYATSLTTLAVHHLVNLHFLLSGYLYAWAVAGPDPAPRRPGLAVRTAVLVLAAGAHAYLAKLLYARAGELPPGAAADPAVGEVAAQWMYYGGDGAEILLAVMLFASWYARQRPRRPARATDAVAT